MNTESGASDDSITGSEGRFGLNMPKSGGIPVRAWVSVRLCAVEELYEIEHTVEER